MAFTVYSFEVSSSFFFHINYFYRMSHRLTSKYMPNELLLIVINVKIVLSS